ncbi:MAG TPA: DUF2214 family protein [Burkholderiales bacterium]|nr:DUF2214 family protein [Burkholderiales bacterium]
MAGEVLFAYLHFLSVIALGAMLVAELLLLSAADALAARRLAWIDLGYLAAAIAALGSGVMRVGWYGKGAAFYLHNPVFWIKLALFVAIGLISITPTRYFLRWRREAPEGGAPAAETAYVRRFVAVEIVLAAFLPLAAVLMARGIGSQP